MIKEIIEQIIQGEDLTFTQAYETADLLMHGELNNSQIASLLTALKNKGESSIEIAGFAKAMRANSIKIKPDKPNTIDVCGTGGDNSGTFNISTAVAFVVAGAGIPVAKHGNRSITSKSGSSDVLTELGVKIDLSPEQSEAALNDLGITFLFAPLYHPAMKYAAPIRRELGFKTIFNMLGPITNPADTKKQMIGTFNNTAAEKMAVACELLNMKKISFVCTDNKYDEILLSDPALVVEFTNEKPLIKYELNNDIFKYPKIKIEDLYGGTPKDNAKIIMDLFTKKEKASHFNVVCANAALALYTAGLFDNLQSCQAAAEESIISGTALRKLNEMKTFGDNK